MRNIYIFYIIQYDSSIVKGFCNKMDEKIDVILRYCGFEIGQAMKAQGITQKELAEMVGSYQGDISKYIRGKSTPSLPLFIKICLALNVPVESLIDLHVEEYRKIG